MLRSESSSVWLAPDGREPVATCGPCAGRQSSVRRGRTTSPDREAFVGASSPTNDSSRGQTFESCVAARELNFRSSVAGATELKRFSEFLRGADRDRTGDLLTASQALSQLSYGPNGAAKLARQDG